MSGGEVENLCGRESGGATVAGQMDAHKRIIYKLVLTGGRKFAQEI